jgi:hypothetical protein
MVRQKVDERCTTAVAAWVANKNPETKKSALLAMKLHHRFKDGEPGKKSNATTLFSSLKEKYREQHKATKKKKNKKSNKKHNPGNNKAASERLRVAAVARLKMSNTPAFRKQRAEEDILEEGDADALAELISTTTVPTKCGRTIVNFSGISMEQMVKLVPILPPTLPPPPPPIRPPTLPPPPPPITPHLLLLVVIVLHNTHFNSRRASLHCSHRRLRRLHHSK